MDDIEKAAKTKDPTTGALRLRCQGLLPKLTDFVQFTAFIDNDREFSVCWDSWIGRMNGDWNEQAMATYLTTYILERDGDVWRAAWASGLGSVPPGFTTYAPNAAEVNNRILKGLLGRKARWLDVVDLVRHVCEALGSRLDKGCYDHLFEVQEKPWKCLLDWPQPKSSSRKEVKKDKNGNPERSQLKRLDVNRLRAVLSALVSIVQYFSVPMPMLTLVLPILAPIPEYRYQNRCQHQSHQKPFWKRFLMTPPTKNPFGNGPPTKNPFGNGF